MVVQTVYKLSLAFLLSQYIVTDGIMKPNDYPLEAKWHERLVIRSKRIGPGMVA